MKRRYERELPQLAPTDAPPEIRQGTNRGAGKDVKRQVRQHPQRDEARVDSEGVHHLVQLNAALDLPVPSRSIP